MSKNSLKFEFLTTRLLLFWNLTITLKFFSHVTRTSLSLSLSPTQTWSVLECVCVWVGTSDRWERERERVRDPFSIIIYLHLFCCLFHFCQIIFVDFVTSSSRPIVPIVCLWHRPDCSWWRNGRNNDFTAAGVSLAMTSIDFVLGWKLLGALNFGRKTLILIKS